MHEIDYVPCYRSPAGTGTANGWWVLQSRARLAFRVAPLAGARISATMKQE